MHHLLNSFPPHKVKNIKIEPHYIVFPDLCPYHYPYEGANYGAIGSLGQIVVKDTFAYGSDHREACHIICIS